MRAHSILLVAAGAAWLAVAGVPRASADVVFPPPDDCPKGQIGITSHRGPECVDPPPTDCPVGWLPRNRGLCVAATCTNDNDCGKGTVCKPADLCQRQVKYESSGGRHAGDAPDTVTETVDICAADRSCPTDGGAPSQCKKAKICLPKDVKKPSPARPKPKSPPPPPVK